MKPKKESNEQTVSVAGDAIGDTAYSERFVLRILLKLANLDSLKEEINDKVFEDNLCTLWDMTSEKDVVLFLLKHDALNLFHFILPTIESPRILEIVFGIIGNMSCQIETLRVLLEKEAFLKLLLEHIKSDDSLVLVQLLRMVTSAVFVTYEDTIGKWMSLFESIGYSQALYFILKNSSNKEVLKIAIENLSSICAFCNIEISRTSFVSHFVSREALEGLTTGFSELTITQKESCKKHEIERVFFISLQITLCMVSFDKSPDIFSPCNEMIVSMMKHILKYYEDKLINEKDIDSDLGYIIELTSSVIDKLQLTETNVMESYFVPCFNMWKALNSAIVLHENGHSDFEDSNDDLDKYSKEIKVPLSTVIVNYIMKCSDNELFAVLDMINGDYECIVSNVDKEMQSNVSRRTANYRTRLIDNVES